MLPLLAAVTIAAAAAATPGYIDLEVSPADARIVERVDGADVEVAARVPWTCRRERVFAAIAGQERSAPLAVTTPSCDERLLLRAASEVGLGDNLRASLVDGWGRGEVAADICTVRPDRARSCRGVALPPGQNVVHAVFRASQPGEWKVEVRSDGRTFSRTVVVVRRRFPAGLPTVLMTGDSMMLATRHVLARRLEGAARAVDDIYVGSGISRPFVIDWRRLPRRQVRAYRPDATVISLGVSDGRPLGGVECCGEDYVAAYGHRVRAMMRTYSRGGKGAVAWFTVPFTRDPERWPHEAAVNTAVARAARGLERVRVVDLVPVLTPDGTFRRDLVREDGTRVRVREADGRHLAPAGARIASRLALKALRRLGVGVGPGKR